MQWPGACIAVELQRSLVTLLPASTRETKGRKHVATCGRFGMPQYSIAQKESDSADDSMWKCVQNQSIFTGVKTIEKGPCLHHRTWQRWSNGGKWVGGGWIFWRDLPFLPAHHSEQSLNDGASDIDFIVWPCLACWSPKLGLHQVAPRSPREEHATPRLGSVFLWGNAQKHAETNWTKFPELMIRSCSRLFVLWQVLFPEHPWTDKFLSSRLFQIHCWFLRLSS